MDIYFVAVLTFLTGCISICSGIRCYSCNSTTYPEKCGDSFHMTSNGSHVIDECDSCYRKVHDARESKVYYRGCVRSAPNAVSYQSGCSKKKEREFKIEECFCNESLCNIAIKGTADVTVLVQWLGVIYSVYCLLR